MAIKLSSNMSISSLDSLSLHVISSPLIVEIKGGNKQANYKIAQQYGSNLVDKDISDQTADQQITTTWTCIDLLTQNPCISSSSTLVTLPPGTTANFPAATFVPYSTIKLSLLGSKDTRTKSIFMYIIFQEYDVPNLDVELTSIDPFGVKINLNEELFFQLKYGQGYNSDVLSYSGTIVYESDSVGVINFDYVELRFTLWDIFKAFKRSNPSFQIRFSVYNPVFFMPSIQILNFQLNFPPDQCVFSVTGNESPYVALQTKFTLQMNSCIDDNNPITYQFFFYASQAEFDEEVKTPSIVRRKQITDIQSSKTASCMFPQGDILIIAFAIDSNQAIFNSTKVITVNPLAITETVYSQKITDLLSLTYQATQQTESYVSQLSILSKDLSDRTSFSSDLINTQKKQIISTLKQIQQNLAPSSKFSSAADKAISNIVGSGIIYSKTEQQSQLDSILTTLNTPITFGNKKIEEIQLELKKQQLFDFFQTTNSLAKVSSINSNSDLSNLNLNILGKIGDLLNYYSLPNEDVQQFTGDQMSLITQKITGKNTCAYYECSREDFFQTQGEIEFASQVEIYSIAIPSFQVDPFFDDTSFLNLSKTFKNYSNETPAAYPFLIPSVTSLTSQQTAIAGKSINLEFDQIGAKSANLTCVSKQSNEWISKGCSQVYNSNKKAFSCICESLNPTTISDDLEALIFNKNLQTAFSSQGISNISNWTNFYCYVAFWLLSSSTGLLIYLQFKGRVLDIVQKTIYSGTTSAKVVPICINSSKSLQSSYSTKNKLFSAKVSPQQIPESILPQQVQWNGPPKAKEDQIIIQKKDKNDDNNSNSEIIDIAVNDSPQFNSRTDGNPQLGSNNDNKDTPKEFQKNISSNTIRSSDAQQLIFQQRNSQLISIIDPITSVEQSPQVNKKQEDTQQFRIQKKHVDQFKLIPKLRQILLFHNFFNIFYLYDPSMSRQLRYAMFYIRTIHSLAISVVYDSQYSRIQMIALSIVNSILIMIVIKLLDFLSKLKRIWHILFTSFLLTILGFYYYLILSIVSGQEYSDSNQAIGSFFILFLMDVLFTSFILAFAFRQLTLKIMSSFGDIKCFKLFVSILQLELIFKMMKE